MKFRLMMTAVFFCSAGASAERTISSERVPSEKKSAGFQIKGVKQEIQLLQRDIQQQKKVFEQARSAVNHALQTIEASEVDIIQLNKKSDKVSSALADLKRQLLLLRSDVTESQNKVGALLRRLHKNGTPDAANLFFSPTDANQRGRDMVYYRQINRAQQQLLNDLSLQTSQLLSISTKLEADIARLSRLREGREKNRRLTKAALASQQHLAMQQKETLIAKTQRLEKLKVDEGRLTSILMAATAQSKAKANAEAAKLETAKKASYDAALAKRQAQLAVQAQQNKEARQATLEGKPVPKVTEVIIDPVPEPILSDPTQRIATTLGKLSWPSAGFIFGHFGTKRPSGSTWKGIYLTQKSGESVLAAMTGRVIYAANLSGYGNTLIIDHGQGYMSVYGGLLDFNVNVGDVVPTGASIAKSSQMADLPSGLYFELRSAGRAINPMPWF
ncbi:MAG: peptidoglycan DD-metalloendopeptidase family protein [Neisseriaceae bacterium]|nr:peptidoglycan DD-metalloendopeptidase family protein [Neisseriaceae bacterium]